MRARSTGWLLPKKAVILTGMLIPSWTAPVLNWMLSALSCWPLLASLKVTRALFTVRLSMSSFIGREAASAWAAFSSPGAFGSVAAVVGTELAAGSGRPMSCQLPWPFSSRVRLRFRPSTRTSLI
ncbi:hypothetical protein D9M71_639750 [compost metagenome]